MHIWLNARPILKIDQNAETPWVNLNFKDEEVAKAGFNHDQWKATNLPNTFEYTEIGQFDGAVWYRKFISIPEKWQGKELVLELGPINDMDVTYFNGQLIGSNEIDGLWQKVRKYTIAADNVKIGENLIAIRVLDIRGNGGLYGKAEDLKIYPTNNAKDFISLSGEWKYLPVAVFFNNNFHLLDIATQEFHQMPKLPLEIGPNTPTVLYNALINPLVPYTIKGAIWYQGESNVGNPQLYTTLFPAMIESWRSVWQSGDFPFYFVQIAPYNYGEWADAAGLREAQFKTLRVPNTGMAVTLDIGNPDHIHPANKPEVGRRLALWALAKDYGKEQIYAGPLYSSMEINGNTIAVSFSHAEGGLKAKDGILKKFEIAGDDRVFHPAKAKITGDQVIVQSSAVNKPVAVRYLWDNASEASLFNSAGLPASSFRTDNW